MPQVPAPRQCVRIGDRGGEAHVRGKDGHPKADQRIPAEGVGKRDDDRHQQDDFFEGARRRVEEHKGQRHHLKERVLTVTETSNDTTDERA
jgi:hypothetical protein